MADAKCPDGAVFEPKTVNSIWLKESSADGGYVQRINSCPAGYALVRKEDNPQADKCVQCPGTTSHGYSLVEARWSGRDNETGLDFFCKPCPKPATAVNCMGGTLVITNKSWFLVQEEAGFDSRRNSGPEGQKDLVFKAYQCDPGVCQKNNTCANGRTGLACGQCPESYVLDGGRCRECNTDAKVLLISRILFVVFGTIVVGLLWFFSSWYVCSYMQP